jgi:serine/threonine-protein kinase
MDQTSQPTFEDTAVDRGYITPAQLDEGRELHKKLTEMGLPSPIEEVFLKKGYLTKQQVAAINAALGKGNADAIPGYVILEKIATGGMGTVYKAKQTSMDRVVALKTLLPKFANERDSRERFLREARAVAKLAHPNIVSGIDSGEANGIYYFVMEFLDGEPLDRVLRKRTRLPWREAATIVRQIALALDHAHKNAMVHRDVKPGNIMLLKDGTVKLADLGLARIASAGDAALTRSGMIVGSPGYVSPEQATGERDLDIRSDLYSLGLTFFEAIVGEPAYTGDSPMTVISSRLTHDPHFEKLAAFDAPKDLIALVTKMCAREAIRRYQTPQYLLEDLDAILRGSRALHAVSSGVQATHGHGSGVHSVHTERRVHKPAPAPRRSPLPAVVGASLGAVVLVLVLVAILRPGGAEKPAETADRGRPAPSTPPPVTSSAPAKRDDPRLTEADERALRAWKMAQKFEEENDDPQQMEEVITVYRKALDESAGTLLASQVKAKIDGLAEKLAKLMKAIAEDIDTEMREFESRRQFGESRKLAEMAGALFSDPAWKKSMEEKREAALKRAYESRDGLVREVDGLIGREDYVAAAEKLSTGFGIEEIDRELALRRGSIEKQRGDLAAAAERDRKADRAALDAAIPRMLDQARVRDTTGALRTADELAKKLRAADTKAEGQLYRDWIGAAHRVVDGARGAFLKMKGGEKVSFDVRVAGKIERVEGSVVTASGDAVIVGERSVALRELAVADLVSLSGVRADLRGPALLAVLERDAGMRKYVEAAQKAKLEFPVKVLAEYQAAVDEEALRAAGTEAARAREKDAEAALVEAEKLAAQKKLDEAHAKLEKFVEEFATTAFAKRSDARVKKLQALFPKEIVLWAADGRGPREWVLKDDPGSAGGKVWVAASGRPTWGTAQGNPYVEFKFNALKGIRYRMWMRMKCGANRAQQNSLGYQLSDAVDASGADWIPVGGNRARILQFWTGDQTPERGWTCHDQYNAANANLDGFVFTFRTTGEKTLRICIVEDGSGFDQVVLSSEKYLDAAPGSDEIVKKK